MTNCWFVSALGSLSSLCTWPSTSLFWLCCHNTQPLCFWPILILISTFGHICHSHHAVQSVNPWTFSPPCLCCYLNTQFLLYSLFSCCRSLLPPTYTYPFPTPLLCLSFSPWYAIFATPWTQTGLSPLFHLLMIWLPACWGPIYNLLLFCTLWNMIYLLFSLEQGQKALKSRASAMDLACIYLEQGFLVCCLNNL